MSSNGMKTSFWGPHAWAFLFSSIAGAYPVSFDENNKEHVKIAKAFISMFSSLQYTLPCSYCRESYRKFYKELPIANFTQSRTRMMKWLYMIHDKVNQKLMEQQRNSYDLFKNNLIKQNVSEAKLKSELKKSKSKIFTTKPSPSFDKVVSMYEKHRAK